MDKQFQKRVKLAIKEIGEVYKKHNLTATLTIRLMNKNKVPLIVKFAMWILAKNGAVIDTLYKDLTKK